jgi:hypothetical protein
MARMRGAWWRLVVGLPTAALIGCGSSSKPASIKPPDVACPAAAVLGGGTLTSAGTTHSAVANDETWLAADSPHLVPEHLFLANGTTLVIEPCAVVVATGGMTFGQTTDSPADLVAVGTLDAPIVFTGEQPQAGSWSTITFQNTTAATRLSFVVFEFGGQETDGVLHLIAPAIGTTNQLAIDNSTIRDGLGSGIVLRGTAELAGTSGALTITRMGGYPIETGAVGVRSLPDGAYAGNTDDRIHILDWRATVPHQAGDVVWHKLSIPYLYDIAAYEFFYVTLTVEPGVHIAVKRWDTSSSTIIFQDGGALIADGKEPSGLILFEGDDATITPSWGGWNFAGPRFGVNGATNSLMNYVQIKDAGNQPSCNGGMACWDVVGACTTAIYVGVNILTMLNTEIDGAGQNGYAVTRGFCGTGDIGYANPLMHNTFRAPMHCPQSDQLPCNTAACTSPLICCEHQPVCYGDILPAE